MTRTIAKEKRKGGRVKGSGKGRDPMVSARFPKPLIDRLDEAATAFGMDRSALLREVVDLGLKAKQVAAAEQG